MNPGLRKWPRVFWNTIWRGTKLCAGGRGDGRKCWIWDGWKAYRLRPPPSTLNQIQKKLLKSMNLLR